MDNQIGCPKLPWMIDFHTSEDGKIPKCQLKAAYSRTLTEHLADLNIKSAIPLRKLTGFVIAFDESSFEHELFQQILNTGLTMAILKMKDYCSPACRCSPGCSDVILKIKHAVDDYSRKIGRVYPLPIALEVLPPEIHIGKLKRGRKLDLQKGDKVSLTSDESWESEVTKDKIYVDNQSLLEALSSGDKLLLNDGQVRLSVIKVVRSVVQCIVEKAGRLISESTVICPEVPLRPEVTLMDEIKFAVDNNLDAVISDCKHKEDVKDIRKKLGDKGRDILIFAKIQARQSLDNIEEIIKEADGIILDRKRLKLEVPVEKMFLVQKIVAAKCNLSGKPCICTAHIPHETDLLPSKSDLSDIANIIIDGVDSILLDFSLPKCPETVERLEELNVVCREAEAAVYQKQIYEDLTYKDWTPIEPIQAIAMAAVQASLKTNAALIFALTVSGRTARIVSKYRPRCPIVGLTRFPYVARQLQAHRGVIPFLIVTKPHTCWTIDVEKRVQVAMTWGKLAGLIQGGDVILIVTGDRPGSGFSNIIKIVYASEVDTLSNEIPPPRN